MNDLTSAAAPIALTIKRTTGKAHEISAASRVRTNKTNNAPSGVMFRPSASHVLVKKPCTRKPYANGDPK
jgi:hypothetical protein